MNDDDGQFEEYRLNKAQCLKPELKLKIGGRIKSKENAQVIIALLRCDKIIAK